MTDPAATRRANQAWGRAIATALVAAGVRSVCVAPGSRSTPLVLALARRPELRLLECLDERSAAFFALGVGRASGEPGAVVTTSGTAVANLLPAAVEAAASEVPLLLLTADRPPGLRGSDANQTIDQGGIFAGCARLALDPGVPSADPEALRVLAAQVARACAAARGRPAGPAHLNLPFPEPLEPESWPPAREEPEVAVPRHHAGRAEPPPGIAAQVAAALASAERPLLVCGPVPDPEGVGNEAVALAREARVPIVADPLSGARFGPGTLDTVAGAADRFLTDPDVRRSLRPDFVLRVGATPTSASTRKLLAESAGAPQTVLDGGGRWKDHQALASDYIRADEALSLSAVRRAADGERNDAWLRRWSGAEAAAQETLDAALEEAARDPAALFEGAVARAVVVAVPAGGVLFASSSMPVRDVDAFAAPREANLRVLGNRGASGIDGIVSSALGAAAALPDGTPALVALVGDLALLHDANGLALAATSPRTLFVVVNNDGGGIFHMLPVRDFEPEFTRYFATPHGLDLSLLGELHGVPHTVASGLADLRAALSAGLAAAQGGLLEIATDREVNRLAREAVTRRVVEAVSATL
ncbi:MAG TPA: 2-succinyl-5-enolpyruvyl-6-hydroxy-3-cyclohexene-1-carboxylic-acid synthase [Longimicrobiales bacterium]|nr:2-succinyl-5-enolpyruvyl-6-hydroxy-3-cyclohexene-1-carboxylic-acid synthase [Longimicrobiales bacterium]